MVEPGKTMLTRLADFGHDDKTAAHYDAWAADYDRDLVETLGYSAHLIGADALALACLDRTIAVIDIGCGTGLVGTALRARGFPTIDGIDIAPEMLAKARDTAAYRQLIKADMTERISVPDAVYDAAICTGSFAPGHLNPTSLRNIIRMVKTGGPIVIFMNGAPFEADNYAAHLERLQAEGLWLIARIETINYMTALDRPGRLIVAHRH